MDGDDAGMFEARGDLGFADEAGLRAVTGVQELFDGDGALEVAVERLHHAAEATTTVLADDVVAVGIARGEIALGHP